MSLIEKINYLAKKAKTEGLTEEEKKEQQKLRNEYLENFRKNMSNVLDNVYIKDEIRTVDIGNQFCISSANLSFARRYGAVKYLFILIWEPGNSVPYEEMGAYAALKKRNVLIVPYCEDVLHIFNNQLQIKEIPLWPKSSLYYGKR